MKLSQTIANIFSSLIAAWMGIVATGALDGMMNTKIVRAISLFASFGSMFLVNMGYNRTPSGTILPDVVTKMVDTNQAHTLGANTTTTVVEGASMQSSEPPKKP